MDTDSKRPFSIELDAGHLAWVVSFLPEAAAVLDDGLVVVAANRWFAETVGLPGEIAGRSVSEFLSEESLGELETALEALRSGCASVMWLDLLVGGSGTAVPCRAGLGRFGNSEPKWFILTLRRDELSRLGLVLDRMAEGVLLVDSAQRIVYANRPFFQICGLNRNQVIGAPLDRLLRLSASDAVAGVETDAEWLPGELIVGDAAVRKIRVRRVPLPMGSEGSPGSVVLVRDDTPRSLIASLRGAADALKHLKGANALEPALRAVLGALGARSASVWEAKAESLECTCEVKLEPCTDVGAALCADEMSAVSSVVFGGRDYAFGATEGGSTRKIFVPLKAGGAVFGALEVDLDAQACFSEEKLLFLQVLGRVFGAYLQTGALASELAMRIRSERALLRAGRGLVGLHQDAAFEVLGTCVSEVLLPRVFQVWEWDEKRSILATRYVRTAKGLDSTGFLVDNQDELHAVISESKPLLTGGKEEPMRAFVPVLVGGKAVGVLGVEAPEGVVYGQAEMAFLEGVAVFAAAVLEHCASLQLSRREAQAELFSRFVSTMNHYVNNYLQAILGNAQLLSAYVARDDPKVASWLDGLLEGCFKLADFTGRLREAERARLDNGESLEEALALISGDGSLREIL
jgi:hypothetical protein